MYYLNTNTPFILFQRTRNSEIYVDKSLLIQEVSKRIRTNMLYICVTRPRRFGKTVNLNMLGAYYTRGMDSGELFDGLAIAGTANYEKHLNQHNVIYIDFSRQPDGCASYEDYITDIQNNLREDIKEAYPEVGERDYSSVSQMLRATAETFLFILDEWDSIFYKAFMGKQDKTQHLEFLKGLLKDQPYVDLAYMTGVLPIAKYTSGSELNMFREYSFMNDHVYEDYFGFLEEEVRDLCQKEGSLSYEELKFWYDGYRTSGGKSLFNPRSVCFALSEGVCLNFWTETGPMNEIADCVEHNVDAVREDVVKLVAGVPIGIQLNGYSAVEQQMDTRDEILSAMVVYGFLSYHDGKVRVPNRELMEKFERVLARESMGEVKAVVDASKETLEATLSCDEEKVAAILEEVHDREIPFLNYNDENSLSCVITLCYLAARDRYIVEREAKSGKGYCDYLFLPKKSGDSAIIVELKVGGGCEAALAQIKERDYAQKARDHGCGEILLVGISYDKEKHHQCKIEKAQTLGKIIKFQ